MQIMASIIKSVFVGAFFLYAMPAQSQVYAGANLGSVDFSSSYGFISIPNQAFSERDFAWGLSIGYAFNRYWAIEAGYSDIGSFNSTKTSINNKESRSIDLTAVELSVKASYPVTDTVSVYARLGEYKWKADTSNSVYADSSEKIYSNTYRSHNVFGGIGVNYSAHDRWRLGGEYTRYDSSLQGSPRLDSVKLIISYEF